MVAFHIRYYQWVDNLDFDGARGEGPIFHVYTGATDLEYGVAVFIAPADVSMLRQEIAVQEETRFPQRLLPTAVRRFAVSRIAQGLKDGLFPPRPPGTNLCMSVEEADFPAIRQLLHEKTCTYQVRQGRDLLCSAASANDPTRLSHTGLQTFAPTSRALCRTCELPHTDYVCSHLMHPGVLRKGDRRQLVEALCDLGRAEIQDPAGCRPGGHACWEWLVEPGLARPDIPLSPLTLPEAFDYLDVCWRLAFGKKQPLVRPKNLTGVAVLSLSCTTRDELIARLSALVDMLNSLAIPDRLLPAPSTVQPGTLNRLQACLKGRLDAADYPACAQAITVLRAVVDLRNSFQHSVTVRDLLTICRQLSLPFPLPDAGETWERIRGTVTEALGLIRDAIRRYVDAGTDA